MMLPTTARIPMLGVDDARAAAARVGVPAGMAALSVFKVLLRHEDLAARVNGLLTSCCGTARSMSACAS